MKHIVGLLVMAVAILGSRGNARAQTGPAGSSEPKAGEAEAEPVSEASDDSARLPSARPAGPDWRTGHFILAGKVGAAIPAGNVTGDVGARDLVGDGIGFGGSIGVGVSRYTVLALSGSYALLPGACDGCSGNSYALGAEFVYHVAQGIAFDPWLSLGASYRSSGFTAATTLANDLEIALQGERYHGVDFARFGLGGDFYPIPGFGFGAYFETALGSYVVRPEPNRGARVYALVEVGVRFAIDPLRWNWTPQGARVGSVR